LAKRFLSEIHPAILYLAKKSHEAERAIYDTMSYHRCPAMSVREPDLIFEKRLPKSRKQRRFTKIAKTVEHATKMGLG
jgi:hypothetical protein